MAILTADAAELIKEILDDPAMPVATLAAYPNGVRISALREALDHLNTTRTAAVGGHDAERLLIELAGIDKDLADVLRWHCTLIAFLETLPPQPARNAVLGDVHRGALLGWATVEHWSWINDIPHEAEPLCSAELKLHTEWYPELYDTVLAWEATSSSLVALPTQRTGLTWQPSGNGWQINSAAVTLHRSELIGLPGDPRQLPDWHEYSVRAHAAPSC